MGWCAGINHVALHTNTESRPREELCPVKSGIGKYTLRRSRQSEMLLVFPFWSLGIDLVGIVQVGLGSVICVQGPRGT